MGSTVTDEQIWTLAATAKPYSLALLHCEVHPCHGFPGDTLPA
ncbi:hypothetical protein [Nocardia salmonicida]|nr:hypothetical protein [Nocardia salmonicida]